MTHRPTSTGGCVAAAFPDAAEAGAQVLRAGGNAVDAACAAAWALSVCEPAESGLGGQTTMLIRTGAGTTVVVDGHSRAPAGLTRSAVPRRDQRRGIRSQTVPSTVATLAGAQRLFGRLGLAEVLAPAIRLAEEGYRITKLQRKLLKWTAPHWAADSPEARLFLRDGGPLKVGDTFRQAELARTLRRLASAGAEDFYTGAIAAEIVADMEARGGLVTREDLRMLWQGAVPVVREPLSIQYRGRQVLSSPPPSGGVQAMLALRVLERLLTGGEDEPAWRLALAEATLAAFRERERWPDHPADIDPSTLRWMISAERAEAIAGRIRAGTAVPRPVDSLGEGGNTTHLCAADSEGGVVSLTQSIQSVFGSKAAHPTLGFVYNNYLSTSPRSRHPYRLGGGSLPQSNATPTLVLGPDGRPLLALGSAGSRRITTSVVQVISAVLDRGMGLAEAVAAPRAHALLSGRCWYERSMDAGSESALRARFAKARRKGKRSYKLGAVQALAWDPRGEVVGVGDPRRDGAAAYGADAESV